MSYSFIIGFRHLRSKKKNFISVITFIAIAGVTLAVAALSTVLAISSGFQHEFRDKILGVNAHIIILKYGINFTEYKKILRKVEKIPEIKGAAPFIINEMMIAYKDTISGVLVKGIDPTALPRVLDLPKYMIKGSVNSLKFVSSKDITSPANDEEIERLIQEFLDEEYNIKKSKEAENIPKVKPSNIIIGKSLAEKLNLKPGSLVNLISPASTLASDIFSSPKPLRPRSQTFKVSGIFYSGFDEYDTRLVYINLSDAQSFYEHGDIVTGVEIKLTDITKSQQIAKRLDKVLNKKENYRIIDWEELNHNLFTALKLQKLILVIILILFVTVAAINIISMLVMIVLEKKREIAILKSMGASNWGIMKIFITQGVTIGTIGTILGIALGYLISYSLHKYGFALDPKVYLINKLPIKIKTIELFFTGIIALLISTVATIIPSWKASKLKPVEGLRY
jgi:lipoprotein-releasing system permease protein